MPKKPSYSYCLAVIERRRIASNFRYAVICVASVKAAEVLLYKVLKKTDLITH